MPEIEEVLPKYLQISGYIRNQIERGELAPGAEVPSERELAASWHVARPTAARALNELRQRGIVESRRGSGTYVVDRSALPAARERGDRARQYGWAYSETASVTVLEAGMVDGPVWVREGLAVAVGGSVLVRKRLVSNDSGVAELATSWFRLRSPRSHRGCSTPSGCRVAPSGISSPSPTIACPTPAIE